MHKCLLCISARELSRQDTPPRSLLMGPETSESLSAAWLGHNPSLLWKFPVEHGGSPDSHLKQGARPQPIPSSPGHRTTAVVTLETQVEVPLNRGSPAHHPSTSVPSPIEWRQQHPQDGVNTRDALLESLAHSQTHARLGVPALGGQVWGLQGTWSLVLLGLSEIE